MSKYLLLNILLLAIYLEYRKKSLLKIVLILVVYFTNADLLMGCG